MAVPSAHIVEIIKRVGEKRVECETWSNLELFCNKFNKFINSGALIMLDSIYILTFFEIMF